jgi:glycerate-2-kinase
LLIALAYSDSKLTGNKAASTGQTLNLSAGDIGDVPVERGIVAVGPGSGDPSTFDTKERIYAAYRALSIENVTVSAKRDEPSMFEVSFRLLPEDTSGSYGKIIDRTFGQS